MEQHVDGHAVYVLHLLDRDPSYDICPRRTSGEKSQTALRIECSASSNLDLLRNLIAPWKRCADQRRKNACGERVKGLVLRTCGLFVWHGKEITSCETALYQPRKARAGMVSECASMTPNSQTQERTGRVQTTPVAQQFCRTRRRALPSTLREQALKDDCEDDHDHRKTEEQAGEPWTGSDDRIAPATLPNRKHDDHGGHGHRDECGVGVSHGNRIRG